MNAETYPFIVRPLPKVSLPSLSLFSRLLTSALAVSIAVITFTPVSMEVRRIRKPSLL